jgi:hypothetical protein
LIHLRARWYNPADGRFQSRDTWGGDVNRPMTMNRWGYVYANPVNLTDPSGHDPWWCESKPTQDEQRKCIDDLVDARTNNAADWAIQHWLEGFNNDNDCTNFASQALLNSGTLPIDPGVWEPGLLNWNNAPAFYNYLLSKGYTPVIFDNVPNYGDDDPTKPETQLNWLKLRDNNSTNRAINGGTGPTWVDFVVFYKLKSAQFIIEKVPTLKKERLKLLFKRGPLYYQYFTKA